MTEGKKLADAALAVGGIALDLATQNHAGAALQALALTKDFASKVVEARMSRWWKGVVENKSWGTPHEVQGMIEAKIKESPNAKEAVWASAKAVLDTISDEAAEIIGSITAVYVRDGKGPDSLLRGFTRVLADLSSNELVLLRGLVREALSQSSSGVGFSVGDTGNVEFKRVGEWKPWTAIPFNEPELIRRIFRLLKSNDLGWDTTTGGFVGRGGPGDVWMDASVLRWLAYHLGVFTPARGDES